jgi:4-amino-4-deoxy-L-arabinose transferase-like glycosyltransferase
METKDRLAPFVWLAYLVIPIEGWGLFSGRPLGGAGAVALAIVCWLWWVRRSLPVPLLAVAALVAKIALGAALLAPRGFDARYYANASFAEPLERSTEPAGPSFTRTDRRLCFAGGCDADLPVYFLNDNRRFNFYLPTEPSRESLPVSAIWEGWLRVPRTGLWRLYARNPGGQVEMSVGDQFSVKIPPSPAGWVGYPTLTAGLTRVRISLSIPQGGSREFAAGWTVDGREEPFDESSVLRDPVSRVRLAADWVVRAGSMAFDFVLSALLFGAVLGALRSAWRGLTASPGIRDALAIGWAAVIVDGLLFAWPRLHRMITLSGGDDWLTYETRARDIALNSIWMLNGMTVGQGTPFFEMPFYPYFLAATHWLFGDDLYGAFLLQRVLLGGAVVALWRLTAALFGERVGGAGLVAALVIVYEKVAPRSGMLLTETLFVPLVCILAFLLVRLARSEQPSWRLAAAAGAVGGLATLTRSTLMMGWPPALLLTLISLRPSKRAFKTVALLVVVLMAVISMATIRNWVVARKFVLINAYGSFNLFLANVPQGEIPVPAEHKAEYDRWHLDRHLQMVVEHARQSPGVFFERFRRRAAYAFGAFDDPGRSVFYTAIWVIALLGLLCLARPPSWVPRAGPASLIPLSLAVMHMAVLIMTFVSVYGDRLLLTFYVLLTPYVAIALFAAHRALWSAAPRIVGWLAWTALLAVTMWWYRGRLLQLNVPLLAVAVAVWSACVFGLARLPRLGALAYGALAVGLSVWIVAYGRADIEHPIRMILLLAVVSLSARGFLVARA